jgi:hypothetical protein
MKENNEGRWGGRGRKREGEEEVVVVVVDGLTRAFLRASYAPSPQTPTTMATHFTDCYWWNDLGITEQD